MSKVVLIYIWEKNKYKIVHKGIWKHSISVIIDKNKINSTKVLDQNIYCESHLEILPTTWSERHLFLFQHQNSNPYFHT